MLTNSSVNTESPNEVHQTVRRETKDKLWSVNEPCYVIPLANLVEQDIFLCVVEIWRVKSRQVFREGWIVRLDLTYHA